MACSQVLLLLDIGAAEVGAVFFVLLAGIRHDLGVLAADGQSDGPGLGVKLGVFERDRPLDVVFVNLLKTLDQMQLIAMLMAGCIEPGAVVEPDRIDYQGVAFPVANGVAKPSGVWIFRVVAPIGIDNSKRPLVLKQDGRYGRRLHNLERHDAGLNSSRRADGQALRQRIVDFVFLFEEVGGIYARGPCGSSKRLSGRTCTNCQGEGQKQANPHEGAVKSGKYRSSAADVSPGHCG